MTDKSKPSLEASSKIEQKNGNKLDMAGVYAPIATPFDGKDAIDHPALIFNLKKYAASGLRGLVVLGTNGENKSLTEEEKLDVLRVVVEHKDPQQLVVAGVMYDALKPAELFVAKAAKTGIDLFLVQCPYYFKKLMSEDVLYGYFTALADVSPIPLLIYNIQSVTGINLSTALLRKLSEHENIIGMKDSSGNGIFDNLQLSRPGFQVLAGSIIQLFPAMLKGSLGGTVSLANYLPGLSVQLWKHGMEKDQEQGQALHDQLVEANKAVTNVHGVAGVKAAMDLFGYKGGYPRKPILPLSAEHKAELRNQLSALKIPGI